MIFTDIATDGMLSGPNFHCVGKGARDCPLRSDFEWRGRHYRTYQTTGRSSGFHGAIVGKALFDGTVDLAEAVAVANAGSDAKGAV